MIIAVDVDYRPDMTACVAGVVFTNWKDAKSTDQHTAVIKEVADYEPGQFYKRELPCILEVLKEFKRPDFIVIDGYVWLDGQGRAGLGAHLHSALNRETPVVGVAKTKFQGSPHAIEVRRGQSKKPLLITTAGLDPFLAATCVRSMHGNHRIPTMLRRVDQLCRGRI